MATMTEHTEGHRAKAARAPRLRFPEHEARRPWLRLLLDAYQVADEGVAVGLRRARQAGRTLVCARGCSACCATQEDIPVYPLELVGLAWYATEQIDGSRRQQLKQRLRDHGGLKECPFLLNGECSVYPLRPMACRHFNVFETACAPGEDPFHTRRDDVLTPVASYKDRALAITLPFYGVRDKKERRALVASGGVHSLAREFKGCNWESLARKMDAFDDREATDG